MCYITKQHICLFFGIFLLPCKDRFKCFTRLKKERHTDESELWSVNKIYANPLPITLLARKLKGPAGKSIKTPGSNEGNMKAIKDKCDQLTQCHGEPLLKWHVII